MGNLLNKICYVLAAVITAIAMTCAKPNKSRPADDGGDTLTNHGGSSAQANPANAAGGAGAIPPGEPFTGTPGDFDSQRAMQLVDNDSAGGGYCARGVANIADDQGLGNFKGMNATDFESRMASQGWQRVEGATPQTAPEGAMLLYNSDLARGNSARNQGGGTYGHVELVGNNNGTKTYISDTGRSNYGGTVPDNFTGAWVRPKTKT